MGIHGGKTFEELRAHILFACTLELLNATYMNVNNLIHGADDFSNMHMYVIDENVHILTA